MIKILPLKFNKRTDWILISAGVLFGIALLIIGVATAIKSIADWGAEHQFVRQQVVALHIQAPYRIEKIGPVKELVVLNTPFDSLTTTEQKIIKVWKDYKTAMIAIAIFDCGESRLDQYAVSHTGDLGIAQINWPIWKDKIKEEFGYNAGDMFNVDKNLEVAYLIWDRGNGVESDGIGSWNAWTSFQNGGYTKCFK